MPKEINIRASAFSTLFDCPHRYEGEQIMKMGQGRTSGRAWLGTAVHHATAIFDTAAMEQKPLRAGDAVDAFVDKLKNPDCDVFWHEYNFKADDAINVGAQLTNTYCLDISPKINWTAVEMKCEPLEVRMENDVIIRLVGSLDRLRSVGDRSGLVDIKTGGGVIKDGQVDVAKHIPQLGVYELLESMAERALGFKIDLPAQIIALPTKGEPVPMIGEVNKPTRILTGDGTRKGLLQMAADMIDRENFYGNTRSPLCSKTWCPRFDTCWYRGK